ncbi:beta-propeller fold lactonase family protein [Candidatus Dependentiae bacterium]|nr:beta-propeller fold lactonase family protein [Candidatus Dependentiae bacterium]
MFPRFLTLLIMLLTSLISHPMCDPCNVRQSAYLPSNNNPISVAYSSNGCLAIANQGNNTVTIYSTNTTNCTPNNTQPITTLTFANGISSPVSVAFSSNGCLAVANQGNSTVTIYAVDANCTTSANPLATLNNATSGIDFPVSVAFSSNGCLAVANIGNNTVTIYAVNPNCTTSANPPAPLATLNNATSGINLPVSVAFSSNGCLAVANADNNTVTIYAVNPNCTTSANPPAPLATLNNATSGISSPRSVAFSSNGCLAVANADNNTVTIYAVDPNCTTSANPPAPLATLNNATSGISSPRSVAFSSNGCLAVANAANDTVTIYAVDANCTTSANPPAPLATLNNATSGISFPRSVAFSSNGCLSVANPGSTGTPGVLVFRSVIPNAPLLTQVTSICNGILNIVGSGAEANAIIQVFSNGNNTSIGTSTAAADGTFSFNTTTALADGTYTITLTQTNDVPCISAPSNALSVTINPNPTISIAANPLVITRGQTSTLTAVLASGTPPYSVAFSDGFVSPVSSNTTVTYAVSPVSTTTYSATLTDSLGCVSNPADSVTITVVNTTPTPTPTPSNLKVALYGPQCRKVTTCKPRITGRATPGATICLYANNKVIGSTKATSKGTFCIIPCKPLRKGCNTIIALARNGNVTVRSNKIQVLVKR